MPSPALSTNLSEGIHQNTTPIVDITFTAPAAEPDTDGFFILSRRGDFSNVEALDIRFSIGGTATNSTDYSVINSTATIPAGEDSVTVPISVIDDAIAEGIKTVILTLLGDPAYVIGQKDSGTVNIADNEVPALTLSFSETTLSEGRTTTGILSRNTPTSEALSVTLSSSDTTAAVVPTTVTIPAGRPLTVFTLTAVDDTRFDDTQIADISATAPGFSRQTAQVSIINNDVAPTVSITATAPASESGVSGHFTLSRTGDTSQADALTVKFSIGGIATNGADYGALDTTAIIPAGESSVIVPISVVDDTYAEGLEDIVFTLTEDTAYIVGTQNTGTVRLIDNDVPSLSLTLNNNTLSEGDTTTGILSRNTPTSEALTVTLASSDTTAVAVPSSVTISAGHSQAIFNIAAIDDTHFDDMQTAILFAAAPGFSTQIAQVSVANDDVAPTINIAATGPTAAEPSSNGLFTISRTGASSNAEALAVSFTVSGTAANSLDYNTIVTTATISAGEDSVTIPVTVLDDADVEGIETVVLTLTESPNYIVGSRNTSTVSIVDNEVPTLALTVADGELSEGDATTVLLSRNTPAIESLTVTLTSSNTTAITVPETVTIPVGQSISLFAIATVDDAKFDGTQTATLSAEAPGFSAQSVEVTVNDNDVASATLTAISTTAVVSADQFQSGSTLTAEAFLDRDQVIDVSIHAPSFSSKTVLISADTNDIAPTASVVITPPVAAEPNTIIAEEESIAAGSTVHEKAVALMQNPTQNMLFGAPDQYELRVGDEDDFILGAADTQFIFGEGGQDILIGDSEGDRGDDFLFGGFGFDTLLGGEGADVMFGDEDDDTLFGGEGNDLLFGGTGFNLLYGGTTAGESAGRDIFALSEGDGLDIIFDFKVGEDAIALTNGLQFGSIFIAQVEENTVIGTTAGDVMAVIENVKADDLGRPTFLMFQT